MSSVVNPIDNEDLYQTVELGGVESPGVVKITGHDTKINWDVKGASGQTGATTTMKDVPPPEITCTFYLADDDDFDDWPAFQSQCESTIKGGTHALDIYHPDLASQNITSVALSFMGGVVHDDKGGQTRVVKFQVQAPPKKAGGTPKGSIAKPKADPNQAALDELKKLTDQVQKTPWDP